MAKNKLTSEQRASLLEWLAADYDWKLIREWFKEKEWPEIARSTVSHYRKQYAIDIERLRSERRDTALSTGLALKSERIKRLVEHADALESIKWEPDKNGRMWNEKAWRETLADIASELGHRKQVHEFEASEELRKALQKLGLTLDDIATDPLAVSLFTHAGIRVQVGVEEAGGDSGEQEPDPE